MVDMLVPRIDRLALRLLGRHVGHGAEDLPVLRFDGGGWRLREPLFGAFRVPGFGETEIEDPQASFIINHDIVGLEVSMGDARTVRTADCIGKRNRHF
ncbi:MAG: hypothetical protein P8127_11365 [Acidobacteriota bacterium]